MLFENAWVTPVCSSTRASIYTGRYGFRNGVRAVGDDLSLDETVLPEVLADAGYTSALFGKWHLGTQTGIGGDNAPRAAGWDHYAGSLRGGVGDYYEWNKTVNGVSSTVTNYATSENVDDALDWIASQGGAWFCTVAFNAPHTPFHDPPDNLHSVDLTGRGNNRVPRYKASIEAMDTEIGRLIGGLGEAADNTVVIFIGDNGTPQRVIETPYTSGKGDIYEGGVRVPLIIRAPGIDSPGRQVTQPVVGADLFPTIAEYARIDANVAVPTCLDGVSLHAILSDNNASHPRRYVYTELVDTIDALFAMGDGRFKLIELNGVVELYDLDNDPFEGNDLLESPDGLSKEAELALETLQSALNTLRIDLTCDGVVGISDLFALFADWGTCPSCPSDLDGDDTVGILDFFVLLAGWTTA